MMRPVGVGRTSRGPIGRRRIDDHRRQTVALDHRLDQTLGRNLAALIGADPLAVGERIVLGREGAVSELQGRHAARVDDALDTGAERLLHDQARALDIAAADLFRVSRPEPIIGSRVEKVAGALERRRQRGAIAEVALANDVRRVEICPRARWTRQNPDGVAAGSQRSRDRGTEKAARARNQNGRRRRRAAHALVAAVACRVAEPIPRNNALSAFTIHAQSLPNRGALLEALANISS